MNVLLVHNFYQQPGGEDSVFAEEHRLLEQNGDGVVRFTVHNDAVAAMGKFELARKTIWNRDAQAALREAIRAHGSDVVHFHNTFPLISPAAYYAAHAEGAAVVQTLHNYRLLCPAATFCRDGEVCEDCLGRAVAWPGVWHKCYRDNRIASAAVAAMLAFHRMKKTWRDEVDAYIALTEFARSKFIEGGLPAERIIVKPNFVDPDPEAGRGSGGYALFVGRLTQEKGVPTLLDAWKLLSATGEIPLRIVGDGPMVDQVRTACRHVAGMEYVGRRPSEVVYGMMGDARMLIFPSQWFEGQPRTIVESLAKGTPVVASRLGSMSEMIEHGRSGMLFAPGDAEDLAQQVRRLMSLPDSEAAAMRRSARQQFEQHYTAGTNYPLLRGIYQFAMDRAGKSATNTEARARGAPTGVM